MMFYPPIPVSPTSVNSRPDARLDDRWGKVGFAPNARKSRAIIIHKNVCALDRQFVRLSRFLPILVASIRSILAI